MKLYFKNLFTKKNNHSELIYKIEQSYFNLQRELLKIEDETRVINGQNLFEWTNTKNLKLQKKIIFKQIVTYDRRSPLYKLWAWLSGSNKTIELKRKWLTLQNHKNILRGVVVPEPLLNISQANLIAATKNKKYLSSKFRSLLKTFSYSLRSIDAKKLSTKDKFELTKIILNSGRHVMFSKRKPTKKVNSKALIKNLNTSELQNLLHQYHFLAGFLDLEIKDITLEKLYSSYSNLMLTLDFEKKSSNYNDIENLYLSIVNLFKFFNKFTISQLNSIILESDPSSLEEAFIHGIKLRYSFYKFVMGIEPESDDYAHIYKSKSRSNLNPFVPSDALISLKLHIPEDNTSQQGQVIDNRILVANFIKACGFYDIPLNDLALGNLIKRHRALQMQIHPDKNEKTFQCCNETHDIQADQSRYLKLRGDLFDKLNTFFNLKSYANKIINLSIFNASEKSFYLNNGKNIRMQFNNLYNIAHQEISKIIIDQKLTYLEKTMHEDHVQRMEKLHNMRSEVKGMKIFFLSLPPKDYVLTESQSACSTYPMAKKSLTRRNSI
jgi:hypothetical protein